MKIEFRGPSPCSIERDVLRRGSMTAAAAENALIAPSELARRAGVTRHAISYATRHALKSAMVGRQIVAAHPLVEGYIRKHKARAATFKGTRGRPSPDDATPKPHNPALAPTPPPDRDVPAPHIAVMDDPLARACAIVRGGAVAGAVVTTAPGESTPAFAPVTTPDAELRRAHTDSVLYNLTTQTAGMLPKDLEDLGRMTLRELIDRCGSFEAVQSATKALKTWADYLKADVEARKKRGDLIERAAVERNVFPYIDLTQKRALEEVPMSVSDQVIARVTSGGEHGDLRVDVQTLIHDALASVYRDCKTTTVAALGVFDS